MSKGIFIVFEGIDGCGKTSVSKKIIEKLELYLNNDQKAIYTREPGGCKIAEDIRKVILNNNNMSPDTEMLLFAAARKEHLEQVIKNELLKNNIVICDRFFLSSVVYQGYLKNVDLKQLINTNKFILKECYPDITFYFDVDTKNAVKRIQNRKNSQNRFDVQDIKKLNELKKFYEDAINELGINVFKIDANQEFDLVINEVFNHILKFI